MPSAKSLLKKPVAARKQSIPRTAGGWRQTELHGVTVLQVPALAKFPWLVHGFSTARGGVSILGENKVLNVGFSNWDNTENVHENRRRLQQAVRGADLALVPLKQFHSDLICEFPRVPDEPCSGDASITGVPGLLLAVQTADCVPILLADPRHRAVAAVHAGWRGTLSRIVEKTIGRMEMQFATRPGELVAAIGPAIGCCCYEVGTEVASAFLSQFADAPDWFDELRTGDEPNPLQWLNQFPPGHQPPPKNVRLDLRKANRAQLLGKGVKSGNLFVSDLCTACRPHLLFSHRKQGAATGRMMAVIGIRTKS